MSLREAQVVRVNPATRTVDLVYLDTREPVQGVRVSGNASSVSGSWDVPDIPRPTSDQAAGVLPATGRSMVALVGTIRGRPVVLSFLPAQGNQVAFTQADLEVHRHPSGVVTSIEADGSMQVTHPGGATLRIGSAAVTNLGSLAADGNWSIPAGAPPTITLETPQVSLVIAAGTGNVSLTTSGDAAVTAKDAIITASGMATLTGAQVILGAGGRRVVVDGDSVVSGRVQASQTRVTAG